MENAGGLSTQVAAVTGHHWSQEIRQSTRAVPFSDYFPIDFDI